MANVLGALVVTLGLNSVEFKEGLSKAQQQAKLFAQELGAGIRTAAAAAGTAIAGIAVAAAGAAVAIDQLIKAAGEFKDLEERTGASAEELASFAVAAKVAGVEVSGIADAMNKLAKNLTGVDDESKAAGAALEAIGISIKDFKQLSPGEQIVALAKAFNGFADGAGKSAAQMALLGKTGAQLNSFFKELEQGSGRQVILTQQQIDQADEYADAQTRVRAQLQLNAQALATQFLPAITAVTKTVSDFITVLIKVDAEAEKLRNSNTIEQWAKNAALWIAKVVDSGQGVIRVFQAVGESLGARGAQISALLSGDFKGAVAIAEDAKKRISDILAAPLFSQQLNKTFAEAEKNAKLKAQEDRGFNPFPKKQVNFSGAEKAAKDNKSAIDAQLKELENFIRDEQETLRDREQFLQHYYQNDQIGLREFFAARKNVLDEATQKQKAAIEAQISILEQAARGTADPEKRIAADQRVADAKARLGRLEQDSITKSTLLYLDEQRAIDQVKDSIEQAGIALAEMRGDSVAAAAASFDFANRRIRAALAELQKSANPEDQKLGGLGNKVLDDTKALIILQKELSNATDKYSLTLGQLENAQARINIQASNGAITELEALRKTSDLRASYVELLRQEIRVAEELALKLENPEARARALANIDAMKVKLEELQATGDLVAKKFNEMFGNAFASALERFVSGEVTLKQAAKDFLKDINRDLTKVAINEIKTRLFGEGGPLSGIGSFFGDLFGGKSKVAGAAPGDALGQAGLQAAATTLTTSGTALTTSATSLTTSGTALTTSGTTLTSSGTILNTAGTVLNSAGASLTSAAAALTTAASTLGSASIGKSASGLGDLFGGLFNLDSPFQGPSFGFAASGSSYTRGGNYLVGENGPEVVSMPVGARVTPKSGMKDQWRNGPTVNINFNGVNPSTASIRQVRNAARDGVMQGIRDR